MYKVKIFETKEKLIASHDFQRLSEAISFMDTFASPLLIKSLEIELNGQIIAKFRKMEMKNGN